VQERHHLKCFPAGWAHQWRNRNLIFLEKDRSRWNSTPRVIFGSIASLCNNYWRYLCFISILFISWTYSMNKGAPFLEEDASWKVLSRGLTPNLFHLSCKAPNIQYYSIPIYFGGHIQGGQNFYPFQLVRGTPVLDLRVRAQHGFFFILYLYSVSLGGSWRPYFYLLLYMKG
jgi:hypothetical protein